MQKCVYDLTDASRFWYLRLKEELINLGALLLTLDKGIFIWNNEHQAIGIVACFVNHSHKKQIVWKHKPNWLFYTLMLRTKLY